MTRLLLFATVIGALLAGSLWTHDAPWSLFVMGTESEHKLVIDQLGNVRRELSEPGLSLKIPFFDTVRSFDRRLQYLNARPVTVQIARSDKLIVDYYVVWAIRDPLAFLEAFPRGMTKAEDRIQEVVNGIVGARVANLDLKDLLARVAALQHLAAELDASLRDEGVQVLDVRISRTELPGRTLDAVYQQMREQQRALARDYRVQGERNARQARAAAEREARTTRAEAHAFSEVARGEGDARAARAYADAYNKDPEFYAFVRSLEAYRKTLGSRTTMVLPPDHEFFRYLDPSPKASD